MEIIIQDNGMEELDMEKAEWNNLVELFMMVNGKLGRSTDMENY
jgi:hypothetical protein